MKDIKDFQRLLDFLIHCIDLEILDGLELARKHAGHKFITPWVDTEPLFFPNAAEVLLSPKTEQEKAFFEKLFKTSSGSQRIHYGYPLRISERGYLSPLFFVEVDISEHNGGYKLHPVWKSLGVNRQLLQNANLSREEADVLVRELEGDFGDFDARLKAAQEALDIPDDIVKPVEVPLSLPSDLFAHQSGWQNVPILFLANINNAKQSLRYELAQLHKSDFLLNRVSDTSLGTLLGLAEPSVDDTMINRHEINLLNNQQAEAVDRALSAPLTVITGPPGTGKSQVVVNILSNCVTSGQTVLFASNNNKPLEEVQQRLAKIMAKAGDWSLRLGNKESRKIARETLLPRLSDEVESNNRCSASEIQQQLSDLALERRKLEQELQTIECLQDAIEKNLEQENRAASVIPLDGIEAFGNDLPPALDSHIMRKAYGELSLQKGESNGGLIFWIRRLLFGQRLLRTLEEKVRELYQRMPQAFRSAVIDDYAQYSLDDLYRLLTYLRNVMIWRDSRIARHDAEQRLKECRVTAEIQDELDAVSNKRVRASGDLMRVTWVDRINTDRVEVRDALKRYFDHLDRLSKGAGKDRAFFKGFEKSAQIITKGLPVWMVTSLSAGTSLPRMPALFDCVVIDEASQSDFASIIPLLYRARRAVLVGDPKQLPHIPGITPRQEDRLASDLEVGGMVVEFSPVQRSAYDIGASAAVRHGYGEVLLSQHYRCHPKIIGFSNAAFYDGRLISRHSGHTPPVLPPGGIHWQDVKGHVDDGPRSTINIAEVEAVVTLIGSWIQHQPNEEAPDWTLGIVTPFRKQANRISERLQEHLWYNQVKSRLTVGTAHTFQGSECDAMVFSPVVTNGMEAFLIEFAAHQDPLLNVAVTRAKNALFVVGDKQSCRSAGGALSKLVKYVENGGTLSSPRPTVPSPAEVAFETILRELEITYETEYEVMRQDGTEPYRLDFMAVSNSGRRYDLEVDGDYHLGDDRFQEDAVRNKFVESKGFEVLRFRARDVLNNEDTVKERLRRLI